MSNSDLPPILPCQDRTLFVRAEVCHSIQQFLFREALLLDHSRYDEWATLIADDIRYRVPVCFARGVGTPTKVNASHFEDNYQSLMAGIRRFRDSGRAVPPASGAYATHVRRFVTNVMVCQRNCDEYDVLSYLLITRPNLSESGGWLVTAERHDQLRRASQQSFKLFRREVTIDQRAQEMPFVDFLL